MNKLILFGTNFKRYRKRRGISQREFAQKLFELTGKKLTLTSISNYETGLHMPPTQVLPAIADILDVSIDALFGKEEAQEMVVEEEEEEIISVKELKQELESLEKEYIIWSAKQDDSLNEPARELAGNCEKLLALAKAQQEELIVLQTELATIREMISFFKK